MQDDDYKVRIVYNSDMYGYMRYGFDLYCKGEQIRCGFLSVCNLVPFPKNIKINTYNQIISLLDKDMTIEEAANNYVDILIEYFKEGSVPLISICNYFDARFKFDTSSLDIKISNVPNNYFNLENLDFSEITLRSKKAAKFISDNRAWVASYVIESFNEIITD